jgi:hypothetical protein
MGLGADHPGECIAGCGGLFDRKPIPIVQAIAGWRNFAIFRRFSKKRYYTKL